MPRALPLELRRMAASADCALFAPPTGRPECTPTAANSSGYTAPITAAAAPPADSPAT